MKNVIQINQGVKMKRSVFAIMFLAFALSANAAEKLEKDESQYVAGLSLVEQVQILRDKQIEVVKIVSASNGPAANPISVYILLLSPEQQGDNASFDVYHIGESFNDVVQSAKIVGDELVIHIQKSEPADNSSGWKTVNRTLKIQIKHDGKRITNPVVLDE